ncbi:AAA family ATPase [Notoacmeibacter ruber]|uniref:ATP-binding protein n=1 Tax=Notoacmeibacter ruber TaxID=2670375 RepID=A0A3L7JDX4_9HYPH|nr:ATP-binding protein [Notoacmeibacter ruber]RLQ88886.1 ATP-binding protein [Notoacmeibacter ruber]
MNAETPLVKATSIAPLSNVAAMMTLIQTLRQRPQISSGFGTFSGPSGYGKTYAARFAQNRTDCLYIEVRSFWTRKTFAQSILAELSIDKPRGTIADMMEQIAYQLGQDPDRVVLIDEADVLVDKNMIELARDIQEMTAAPVILIGEEKLTEKLKRFERIDNRILDRVLAQPSDSDDASVLAEIICPKLTVSDKLLTHIVERCKGRTRRIANTLHSVAASARRAGLSEICIDGFDGTIDTGEIPRRSVR